METAELAKNIVIELQNSGCLEKAIRKVMATPNTTTQYPTPEKTSLSYSLRGDCMSLVESITEKYDVESRVVYGALKKLTGVTQPEANEEQLNQRVEILQRWLQTGEFK